MIAAKFCLKKFRNAPSIERLRSDRGLSLPLTLMMLMVITGVSAIIATVSQQSLIRIKIDEDTSSTYYASEGSLNKSVGELSVYGPLFDQLAPLAGVPSGYTQFSPATYPTTNGIPTCAGIACHRNMYPIGGGLLKNLGSLEGDGATVDAAFPITEQLDYADPPNPDIELGGLSTWFQIERLDETTPSLSSVGGSLSSSISEGGNAKEVRFRITSYSLKELRGRYGISVLVSVVEVPMS